MSTFVHMSGKDTRQWTHEVREDPGSIRLDDYCGPVFTMLGSKSATKKAIKSGRLTVNGKPATTAHWVQTGDIIVLTGSGIRPIRKIDLKLDIIYQDDYLVVVFKPGGIAVNGNRHKTVENALALQCPPPALPDALPRPVAVHRIDVATNGLVVLARTRQAQQRTSSLFEHRHVRKSYLAVVHGACPDHGEITDPIHDQSALTRYQTLRRVRSRKFGHLSLVKLHPVTGRTHQLRIHLQQQGHLIVGDRLYQGEQSTILGKGMMLCAAGINMQHPITNEHIEVSIDPPAKFDRLLDREEQRFQSQ